MGNILLYSRKSVKSPTSDRTVSLLSEQLQQIGHQVDVSHSLNIPRLILNSYDAVHLVIENLPLTANEALHLGICKALGKSTLISILNSDRNLKRAFLNFIRPDALSVSQTNHFKYYRNISANKFILPAFPNLEIGFKKCEYRHEAVLVPLFEDFSEAVELNLPGTVYIDGRKLTKKRSSATVRKEWNTLCASGKLSENYHLVLSDNKVFEILNDHTAAVLLADPRFTHCELTEWLGQVMNRRNLVIINDFQATGFSAYWTSGRNCFVINAQNWRSAVRHLDFSSSLLCTAAKPGEMFEASVNEISRLYSKLAQQKTSLLASRSVKL